MRTPKRPAKTRVASGFRALELNTSGAPKPIPHTASAPATMNYERKKKVAGLRSTSRKAKRMY